LHPKHDITSRFTCGRRNCLIASTAMRRRSAVEPEDDSARLHCDFMNAAMWLQLKPAIDFADYFSRSHFLLL